MNSSHCHAEPSCAKNPNHSQNPILWPATFRETITLVSTYSHAADSTCIEVRGRRKKNSTRFDKHLTLTQRHCQLNNILSNSNTLACAVVLRPSNGPQAVIKMKLWWRSRHLHWWIIEKTMAECDTTLRPIWESRFSCTYTLDYVLAMLQVYAPAGDI